MTYKNSAEFAKKICGKRVAVMGLGVNNLKLVSFLADRGAKVCVFDKSNEEKLHNNIEAVKDRVEDFFIGSDYLTHLTGFDFIFRTPGMRPDIPEISAEVSRGAVLTSEMEVFLELCPAKIFGITGSDGKTTTTTLIYTMLNSAGYKCHLGGNIGFPLLWCVDDITADDAVILELSSFQLMGMKYSADIAVITNITPNHLDVHKSYDEYKGAKAKVFSNNPSGRVVLNLENPETKLIYDEISNSGSGREIIAFSKKNIDRGVTVRSGIVGYADGNDFLTIMPVGDIKLPGEHNVENYLAAAAAVKGYVSPEIIAETARTFSGVEHRLEFVRTLDNVSYYNDSIATSPSRTIAALKSFKKRVILIAGGKEKGIPFDALGEYLSKNVSVLIVLGLTADKIIAALRKYIVSNIDAAAPVIIRVNSYEEAVGEAAARATDGDVVLLSPASTSYDMFDNFMQRGKCFKDLVNGLKSVKK